MESESFVLHSLAIEFVICKAVGLLNGTKSPAGD